MTVLVWDGKTLAADKMSSFGDNHCTVTKIFKHENILIGFSGLICLGHAMKSWLVGGCKPDEFPAMQSTTEYSEIVVIQKQNRGKPIVSIYEQTPFPFQIEDKFFAGGSGREFAIAALHCGKTAREAVEIACIYSLSCGNGIDTLTF